jgi:nicotinamidase-related amidase
MVAVRTSRLLNSENSVLLIVDIQEKLLPAMAEPEKLLEQAGILIQAGSLLKIPMVVSEQVPQKLGAISGVLKKLLPLEAAIFEKTAFGCGEDPDLLAFLASLNRKQIILCGMETHVCVNQSAHQLLQEGYQIHLVTDAVQSRSKKDHKIGLAKMQQSGIIPATTESVLFELMGTSEHSAFRSIQALIK